jgi:hypothetical protein
MLRALTEGGYLTAEEAAILPLVLNTTIHDLRTNHKRPLQ